MSGINKVILIGHVGLTPAFKYLPDNTAKLTFQLGTTDFMNRDGIRREETEWHHIVMRNTLAEAGQKALHEGILICVQGKSLTRVIENKNGQKSYVNEIIAESFTILGRQSDFEVEDMPSGRTPGSS